VTFDEFYTAMAIEGLDKNKDGAPARSLPASPRSTSKGSRNLGTHLSRACRARRESQDARDYWLEHKDGALSLHFTVPFAQPIPEKAGLRLRGAGSGLHIAFVPAKTDPRSCRGRTEVVQGISATCGGSDDAERSRRLQLQAPSVPPGGLYRLQD
jgi:hypothetical protein